MTSSPAPSTPLPAPEVAADRTSAARAALAVGLAPTLVLAAFTLVVGGWIEAGVGFTVFAACTAWVVYEMHRWSDPGAAVEPLLTLAGPPLDPGPAATAAADALARAWAAGLGAARVTEAAASDRTPDRFPAPH